MPLITLTPFYKPIVIPNTAYYDYVITLSPIAYWRLGEVAPGTINDVFTGTNGDPLNNNLWTSDPAITIQNNKANYTEASTGVTGNFNFISNYKFNTDFDYQIDFDFINFSESTVDENGIYLSGFDGRVLIYRRRSTADGNVYMFRVYNEDFSSLVATFTTATTDTVGKLRLKRVGNTFTGYYWSGTQWEWNGDTNGISGIYTFDDVLVSNKPNISFQKGDIVYDANMDNFQVNSGTIIADEAIDDTGLHNGIYINNPTLGTAGLLVGDTNTSATLDGVDQYVNIGTGLNTQIGTGDMSVSFLVNFNSLLSTWRTVDNRGTGNTADLTLGFQISGTTGKIDNTVVQTGANDNFVSFQTDTTDYFVTGITYHVTFTYVKSSATLLFYLNGALESTGAITGSPQGQNYVSARSLSLGIASNDLSHPLDGTIDEVSLFDKVLTPSEIINLYQISVGGSTAYDDYLISLTPLAYWKLDETGSAATAIESINGYNATYVGTFDLDVPGLVTQGSGTAADFTALNNYMSFVNNADFAFGTGDFSFTFLVQTNNEANNEFFIGGRAAVGGNLTITTGGFFGAEFIGRIRYYGSEFIYSTARIDDGNIHQIVVTRESSAIKIYIDGGIDGTGTDTADYALTTGTWYIGKNDSGNQDYLDGIMDNISIFTRALSQTEVTELYQKSIGN